MGQFRVREEGISTKENYKQNFFLFSTHIGIKGEEGHYIWYQSKKVKTLGPDGLVNTQV